MSGIKARLVVVLGAGGVGKTTTAAALASGFASQGLRTVVITVDPARRLAQALGLDSLSNEPKLVQDFENGGSLSALWIDTHGAFEDLVRRYITVKESADRVLNDRLFRILQNQLGGVEEYLGVEKVLTLGRSGDFDVCVLDTPPSRHALDFLESPRHLIRFFDESVLRVFSSGEEKEESPGFFRKIIQGGKQQAIEVFRKFLGKTFLSELADMLTLLKPVHKVFRETAEGIETWVAAPTTRFVGVSLLEPYPLDEVRVIGLELESRSLPSPHVLILNKCLPTSPPPLAMLTQLLGADAARDLTERHAAQAKLREKIKRDGLASLATAELLRYSSKSLDREGLLGLGRKILEVWQPKDPNLFSKN